MGSDTDVLRETLLDHLKVMHRRASYQVGVVALLEGLTGDDAGWVPPGGVHSIRDLVYHMRYWTSWVVDVVSGRCSPLPPQPARDWPDMLGPDADEVEWESLLGGLLSALSELEEAVERAPEDRLRSPDRGAALVLALTAHNLYHAGQVAMIRRLLGKAVQYPHGD